MDNIWYRNPSKSEDIGRCGGDEKNRMTTQNRNKANAKQMFKNDLTCIFLPFREHNIDEKKVEIVL